MAASRLKSGKVFFTSGNPHLDGLSKNEGVIVTDAILNHDRGGKAIAMVACLGTAYPCIIVVGATEDIRQSMAENKLMAVREEPLYGGSTAMLIPLKLPAFFPDTNPFEFSLKGFVRQRIKPLSRLKYPNRKLPIERKANDRMTIEQIHLLRAAAGITNRAPGWYPKQGQGGAPRGILGGPFDRRGTTKGRGGTATAFIM